MKEANEAAPRLGAPQDRGWRLGGRFLAVLVLLGSPALIRYIDEIEAQKDRAADRAEIANRLATASRELQHELQARLLLTRGLESAVLTDPAGAAKRFDVIAKGLIGKLAAVKSLQLAPNGVVAHVTDVERNRAAIGYDIFADPTQSALARAARDNREYLIAGPLALRQGGTALIARQPVFVASGPQGAETFWGFATVLIDVHTLLQETLLTSLPEGVAIAIRAIEPSGLAHPAFFGDAGAFNEVDALAEVSLPAGSWQIAATRQTPLPKSARRQWLWPLGLALGVLLALAIFAGVQRQERLRRAVRRATLDLAQANDQLKLERDRLGMALQGARLGLWEADVPGARVSLDEHWATLTGETPGKVTRTTAELLENVPAEDRVRLLGTAKDIAKGHVSTYEVEHRYQSAAKGLRWILARGKVVAWNDQGRPLTVIGTNEDITERKEAEETLRRARAEADSANKAKSDFLAQMSHEIRTPMNGVIGILDVLEQGSLSDRQRELLQVARESATSLLRLIDDILDLSKIEAGSLTLESAPLQPERLVEQVGDALGTLAEAKGVDLAIFVDPALPRYLTGDSLRLRQVLWNLVHNGIKFASDTERRGHVSLRASVAARTEQGVLARFEVVDNGIGMDEGARERLFRRFSQAEDSTARRYGGSGLGLSICQELVNRMNGGITVASAPGEGATFTVTLPLDMPAHDEEIDEAAATVAGLRCLIVGDRNGLADDLDAYLAHAGASTERITDPAAALERRDAWPRSACVWIIDGDGRPTAVDALRAAVCHELGQEARFVEIGRRWHREPQLIAPRHVVLGRNLLRRRALLTAVAIAAGRQQPSEPSRPGPRAAQPFSPPSREDALREGRLILVAEDNETNQKVITHQLALLGYAADIADNGREALDCWRRRRYAMVFTDLNMPELDGYGLAASIRSEESPSDRTAVVALTANALRGEAEKCRSAGMDDYLTKPVSLARMKLALDRWARPAAEPVSTTTAPSSTPSPCPVDVSVLNALVGDDAAARAMLLGEFRASATKTAGELKASYLKGETAEMGKAAHKLKSSARSMGALELGELCDEIEQAERSGQIEALASLMPRFESAIAAVDDYLRQL